MAKILIIDDDDEVRNTIVRTLKRAGHDILEAADGVKGLATFRSQKPDLVITDIFMPKQEGIGTILEIRAETTYVPVVAISGGSVDTGNTFLRMSSSARC